MRPLVIIGAGGCFFPLAILFNTFFGLFFLRPLHWFLIEAVLFLLFFLATVHTARRMMNPGKRSREGVIDVEGKVMDEDQDAKRKIKHEK